MSTLAIVHTVHAGYCYIQCGLLHLCRYEASERKGDYGYEAEFLRYLERMIRDLDRRITRGKTRLRMSAAAKQQVRAVCV